MKKQYSKQIVTLLSILATVGTVHAESGMVQIDVSPDKSEIIRDLVSIGAIKPLQEENWYEINHELLNELKVSRSVEVQNSQKRIVDMLQKLVGPNTEVSRVQLLNARMSSQDYPGVSK